MHLQASHYIPCARCGETVTESTPDFMDSLVTGVWPETSREPRWYTVSARQDDVGNVDVSYTIHTPAKCARARRKREWRVA